MFISLLHNCDLRDTKSEPGRQKSSTPDYLVITLATGTTFRHSSGHLLLMPQELY